jgi:sialidase-1
MFVDWRHAALHAHTAASDDNGTTWRIGGLLNGRHLSNECQAALLKNGSLALFARGLLSERLVAVSNDNGTSFLPTQPIAALRAPLGGCEGSTVVDARRGRLLYSGPTPSVSPLRVNMTLHASTDSGATWAALDIIDPGPSAYSSLALMSSGSIGLLYERAPPPARLIFVPTAISFVTLDL